jgi:hypothetical protein
MTLTEMIIGAGLLMIVAAVAVLAWAFPRLPRRF